MRKVLCIVLSALLTLIAVMQPILYAEPVKAADSRLNRLETLMEEKSYLEILQIAPEITLTKDEAEKLEDKFKDEKKADEKDLKQKEKQLKKQIELAKDQLEELGKNQKLREGSSISLQRRQLYCDIERLEKQLSETRILRKETTKINLENKLAKLELLQDWPKARRKIQEAIETGEARKRKFGNPEDIGFREVGKGQDKDVKLGQEAIRELEQQGLMPPRLEDERVLRYVNSVAQRIARNSDLKIPLQVQVLHSEEINAAALPGGFLFVNTGLIMRADNEAELAGVLAHEIAHSAARHGARLMKRATIAQLIYQAAQIAAFIFTGGVVGLGTYYALEYGFYGLGLFLNLKLLGVSRNFELEADQLGAQYLWKAGYDPRAFITFFDKLASEKGYVRSTSFFRTHPAFSDRIIRTFGEITYLPEELEHTQDTPRFQEIKTHLRSRLKDIKRKEKGTEKRPTLVRGRIDCPEEDTESQGIRRIEP